MIVDATTQNRSTFNFSKPVEVDAAGRKDPLFSELVATRAFQRLQSIRFLGGIDYLLARAPNGARGNIRYTRYQHSLGVARLAQQYCKLRALSPADHRLVYVTALLHDIGHAPFSHSLEPVFKDWFGVDHHRATEDIISGRAPLGREVYTTLRRYGIDVERVIAMISGKEKGYDGFFSDPINFDTVEGILRSHSYNKQSRTNPSPGMVIESALRRRNEADRRVVDDFWLCKDQAYRHFIRSRAGVLADFACQLFLRRHFKHIAADDFFGTEASMFRKLPGLREFLTNRCFETNILRELDTPIVYSERRFFVRSSADFFAREDGRRYCQRKEDRNILPRAIDVSREDVKKRDLFDDESSD